MGMRATVYLISAEACAAAAAGDLDALERVDAAVDLDKAWHAIHYLVTGDTGHRFLTTGTQLADVGEPCELHSPAAIRSLSEGLGAATTSDLMARFDPDAFNRLGIYQAPWNARAAAHVRPRLDAFLATLRTAARDGCGLFVVMA